MTALTRAAILAADDLAAETVAVPEWGGTLQVRVMTGTERDGLFKALTGADGKLSMVDYRERLLIATVQDDVGEPVFNEADVAALRGKSAVVTTRLFLVADRLNQLTNNAVDAAEKN